MLIDVNERALEAYGYSREELVGRPLRDLRVPELQEALGQDLRQLARQGFFSYQAYHVRKNGERFPVDVHARYFEREGHGFFHGIIRDITDRAALERQLRESAEAYRLLFESANDAIVVAEADTGIIIDVNRKTAELVGWSVEELRGRHHTELHPPERRGEAMSNLRGRITGEKRETLTVAFYSRDGRVIPVEVNATTIPFQGRAAVVGIFRDLTERMASEDALRRSEESYRVAAEQTGQLLYDLDVPTGRIEWRGAIPALTGYTAEEFARVGVVEWEEMIHPGDRDQVGRAFHDALTAGARFYADYRFRRKDGSYFLAEDHGVCLTAGNAQTVRMVGTMRDVTAVRASEEELHQSETRRQKLESLALLAGGIAHDFNNLLTGIAGNLSLALEDVADTSEAHASLKEAERAAVRAQDLTRQLLTFSKGGAPIKQVVDLRDLVRETVLFACRGTSVRCDIRLPASPVPAEIDEGQLAQVINNITLNAVQAMPAGGVLTAAVAPVALHEGTPLALPAGRYARITITDTGIGIPADLLGRVFDPYFTTKQQGSGLGLAISHSIVSRHGGAIDVRSQVGSGSEFEVWLPAASRAPDRAEAARSAAVAGGGRVLVMDDDDQVRGLALRMLGRLGFEGHGVRDGEAAIAAYREALAEGRRFDLVIMDLTISGGMGGKEAVKGVLELDPDAKVIVSSGYSNDPVMASYEEHGFAAVLSKPYRFEEMKAVFARLRPAGA